MRYRVDLRYGYASYDESDVERAIDLYAREGLRMFREDTREVLLGAEHGVKWPVEAAS